MSRRQPLRSVWRLLALLGLALLLGACQSTGIGGSAAPAAYTADELQKRLPALKHWQAEGKIAITLADDRQSASFSWQQFDRNYNIHVFGPFGQGSTKIKRTSKGVTLENAELGLHRADSAEQLMEQLVGWQVPVDAMQYWIKGAPAPGLAESVTRDANGLLRQIVQDGWSVDITAYQYVGRWRLPSRLTAQREQVRLLVVIKDWQPRTGGAWY